MDDKINVTLDINALVSAYNKEDFMKKVFVEAISKNTSLIAEHVRDYAVKEIMKDDLNEKIKAECEKRMQEFIAGGDAKYGQDFGFRRQLESLVSDAVKENKKQIERKVVNAIEGSLTKERVASHIQDIVKQRVMAALGEVCEGCDRDQY